MRDDLINRNSQDISVFPSKHNNMTTPILLSFSFTDHDTSLTWTVRSGLLGVEFGFQRSSRFEFAFGELRQIRHDGLLVNAGVNDLLGSDNLQTETVTL